MDRDDLLRALVNMRILEQLMGERHRAPSATPSAPRLNPEYVLVAAFDFGTTYSGYAFSLKSSPDDIRMNKNWGSSLGCALYKTSTSVLVNPDGNFDSFGFEAQRKYAEMLDDQAKTYLYFERFKMALHNNMVR